MQEIGSKESQFGFHYFCGGSRQKCPPITWLLLFAYVTEFLADLKEAFNLVNSVYSNKLCALAIDEAHVIR